MYKVVVMVRNKIITFNLEIQLAVRLLHLFLLSLETKTSVRFKVFLSVILVIFFFK